MKTNKFELSEQILALSFIAAGIALRVLPHPMNFSPVMAIALFSGFFLSRKLAFTVPLILMMASDLLIGTHDLFWLTWGAFAVITLWGSWLGDRPAPGRIVGASLAGSVFFFVMTNLGVFLFETLYPKTLAGLQQCFVLAIPFFRNALAGDLFYTAVLFGSFALAKKLVLRPAAS